MSVSTSYFVCCPQSGLEAKLWKPISDEPNQASTRLKRTAGLRISPLRMAIQWEIFRNSFVLLASPTGFEPVLSP